MYSNVFLLNHHVVIRLFSPGNDIFRNDIGNIHHLFPSLHTSKAEILEWRTDEVQPKVLVFARALCEEIEMVAISYALWLLVQFCKCWKVQGLWERGGEKGEEVGLIYSWCSSGSFYEAFQSSSFREDWKWPTNRRTRIWSTCKFSFQFAFTRHWRQQSYNWICNMHF